MEDNLSKFLKIAGLVLLSLLIFLIAVALLVVGLRFIFGLFGHMPWVVLFYKMVILVLPAALFINVYIYFFRITKRHSSRSARNISFFVFAVAVLTLILAYGYDLRSFITLSGRDTSAGSTVRNYLSYHTVFLSAHVLCLILIGVLQALAAPAEKDWLEKAREKEEYY